MNNEMVQQEQMERKLIVEEIRKNGVQLQVTEPSYSASIQDEVQERATTFATGEQQFQEALRFLDQNKSSATKKASPLMVIQR